MEAIVLKIAASLSEGADGKASDLPVASGSRADQWHNGSPALNSHQACTTIFLWPRCR